MQNAAKMTAEELRECVANHPKRQSQIAKELGISPTTIGRWLKGQRSIGPTDEKLLRLYFFEEMPFGSLRPSEKLRAALTFTAAEWNIITILAHRQGFISPQAWITAQIRGYLEHNPQALEETKKARITPQSSVDILPDDFESRLEQITDPRKREAPQSGTDDRTRKK